MSEDRIPIPEDLGNAATHAILVSALYGHASEEARAAWDRAYEIQESYHLHGWPLPPRLGGHEGS